MDKNKARKIAKTITDSELKDMLLRAKERVPDWNQRSIVNKGCSKGVAWNLLTHDFDKHDTAFAIKLNLIREFGEYLPYKRSHDVIYRVDLAIVHQEPNLDNVK